MSGEPSTLDTDATVDGGDSGSSLRPRVWAVLAEGAQLGRYVVLRPLGAGAMGTVYLAYDPELDRQVAVKLLRGGTSAERRRPLLREAQAMAKLTHPNVVGVYDVGEHEGRVYIAMEFVEGTTLRQWLEEQHRTRREVVEHFLLAGRGLQAAHECGLIHRDFKPDNVMVSADGRVRVMDFGLARGDAPSTEGEEPDSHEWSGSLLTVATVGKIAGTPAYMAPEQTVGKDVGAASDQFAFCVSLWESLCGRRPFDGETYGELFNNVAKGRIRMPAASARMPRWLRRTLVRGLRASPDDRWPSMQDLLSCLEGGLGRWRWQLALGVTAMLAVPAGLWTANDARRAQEQEDRITACERAGSEVETVWNDEARDRLRAGLLSTGVTFAEDSVDTIVPWLDQYARLWAIGRTEACRHESVYADWDGERLDRSAWCFEDRLLQLEATADQIAQSDARAARRAVRLASYLDPVDTCLDPKLLERLPAPPRETRAEIRSIRGDLVASDRFRHAGTVGAALELAAQGRRRAEALAWPPLHAAASFIEGRCLLEGGQVDGANATLTRAYFLAQEAGSAEVAFRAARSLVRVHTNLEQYGQAEVWGQHADVLAAEIGDPGQLDEAEGHYLNIAVYLGLGDVDAAEAEAEQALALRSSVLGPEHPITAAVLRQLGRVYLAQDRADEALEEFTRATEVWEAAVGREHPHVGELIALQGRALGAIGRPEDGLPLAQEGLFILQRARGEGHPQVVAARHQLDDLVRAHGLPPGPRVCVDC